MSEFKEFYFSILSKWSGFILHVKEQTRLNIEIVKAKTVKFFI
ncbi:MAG TPA: hypothetical protein PKG60_08610 [Spirochaetota bacterium]|nr:hypothetical protein [Spirochaetota bacterium]HPS86121.1 hypothetical protein [Spirochaetota bacterium]